MRKIHTILRETKSRIVTRSELDRLADKYHFNKIGLRKLLLNKGYLITIFRGVYYLRSYEEKKFNAIKYSPYELLSLGLKAKGIKWYFGLSTALKLLGLTHEVFPVNIVINDKFHRNKPMKIAGSSFLFIELKPALLFDIKKIKTENKIEIYHSKLEKTLLDMLYLKKTVDLKEYKFNKPLLLKKSDRYNQVLKNKVKEAL